jgi:uncharacterized repeat protein (TIGR03803 family)
MIDLRLGRYALGVCVTIAMLAGCGGSQDAISGAPLPLSPAGVTAERAQVRPAYSVLYSFKGGSGDGANPVAGLLNVNGTFYGTTEVGGSTKCYYNQGCGTVFTITPSGTETVLHSFKGKPDGGSPRAALINVNGTFYGTTETGGAYKDGTVFSITPSGKETVLHSFGRNHQRPGGGELPYAGLLNVNGTLYGTTIRGGANYAGTVFTITTSGKEKVLYSIGMGSGNSEFPYAGLINVKGTLYGTTSESDGLPNSGTVFSITLSGKETLLHTFDGTSGDGYAPYAGLANVNGTLYGTTSLGGASGDGIVFAITKSGTETVLHSFPTGSGDGRYPEAGLLNVNGTLYGTTIEGPGGGPGTVFSITTSGKETVLHVFGGNGDAAFPYAGLINVNGTLYGTTAGGGADGRGTVFSISP